MTPAALHCRCCGHETAAPEEIAGRDRWQGVPGEFVVRVCARCDAGTTFPLLAEDELGPLYPSAYSPYVPVEGGITGTIYGFLLERSLRAEPVRTVLGRAPGRVLDVGCGRGDIPAQMVKRGWQAT